MNRRVNASRRQLALFLEPETRYPLPEEAQEALVAALAELLLEALGTPFSTLPSVSGEDDEPEDHP